MKHSMLIAVLITAVLTGCAIVPIEGIDTRVKLEGYKVAYAQDYGLGKGNIIEWIPESEKLSTWSKMVSVQFLEGEIRHPEQLMQSLKDKMLSRCPNAKWSVIESDKARILYEWSITECAGEGDQFELAQLLRGNDGLHRMAYTQKGQPLTQYSREIWTAHLKAARVVKGRDKTPIVLKRE